MIASAGVVELRAYEVNVDSCLFRPRGKGYASLPVELPLERLARETEHTVATLLIHRENTRSLALARRLGFVETARSTGSPSSVAASVG